MSQTYIQIEGARVNNLKDISLQIPHNTLCVITGLSGSGKSSLAFDTIHAEGQRRYLETLSSYARQFIGNLERPEVDTITGLNPVIAIQQKTISKNPRSTVGTITEVYDFIRLLYAKAADAYSPTTGKKMVKYTSAQLLDLLLTEYANKKCIILAPVVVGRKGHYKEQLEQILHKGFLEARIDGTIEEIRPGMKLDRYKAHYIEIVIDKVIPGNTDISRLKESIESALGNGKGTFAIMDMENGNLRHYSKNLMCPDTGLSFPEPAPHTFSFNSPQGACPHCKGLGYIAKLDINKIIPNRNLSIADGAIEPLGKRRDNLIFKHIEALAKHLGQSIFVPVKDLPEDFINTLLYGSEEYYPISTIMGGTYMATFPGILQKLEQDEAADEIDTKKERFYEKAVCPECHGKRLKSEALCFKIAGKDISELCQMDIEKLYSWFCTINEHLTERQKSISADVIKEIKDRLGFLLDVGLSYLSLNRSSRTLSGGESQRIRLATQIGSKLVNVLYILDEPSIGLHQRDNTKLINALKQLRDEGNTIIVVEHDAETMLNADYLIDLGPEAGRKGGELLFAGDIKTFLKSKIDSFTHDYLTGVKQIEIPSVRRKGNGLTIDIEGATGNNLKDINVSFPLGTLTCITGVSGSGKSSLINGTLVPFITHKLYHSVAELLPVRAINGLENIDKCVTIDQSPIGRSPRSNPATYTGVFSDIRKLFGETPDAKIRGFKAGHFSFNVPGGRCEECKGCGVKLIEMNFLPDVYVPCPTCNKMRYKSDTLEVHYKGKNINDVLEMTVNQAVEFFSNIPSIAQKMETLQRVGLGYIKLGQASTTLSGGESQRLKLAGELYKRDTGNTLYVLDEPTTGLHIEDIRVLMGILQALVDKGNTVLVIEHNLDVIKCADYIIDMGKEGGEAGGNILFAGTPEQLAGFKDSYTGQYLKNILKL